LKQEFQRAVNIAVTDGLDSEQSDADQDADCFITKRITRGHQPMDREMWQKAPDLTRRTDLVRIGKRLGFILKAES
jgi:hypothetical protein